MSNDLQVHNGQQCQFYHARCLDMCVSEKSVLYQNGHIYAYACKKTTAFNSCMLI